jgi:hypothetical protein
MTSPCGVGGYSAHRGRYSTNETFGGLADGINFVPTARVPHLESRLVCPEAASSDLTNESALTYQTLRSNVTFYYFSFLRRPDYSAMCGERGPSSDNHPAS